MRRGGHVGGLGHRFAIPEEKKSAADSAPSPPPGATSAADGGSGAGRALVRRLREATEALSGQSDRGRLHATIRSAADGLVTGVPGAVTALAIGGPDDLTIVDLEGRLSASIMTRSSARDLQEPMQTALRSGRPIQTDYPDTATIEWLGFNRPGATVVRHVSMAPIVHRQSVAGALFVGAAEPLSVEIEDALTVLAAHAGAELADGKLRAEHERRLAEKDSLAQEMEGMLRRLEQQVKGATYVEPIDPDAPPLYVSPVLESMLGYPVDHWRTDPTMWTKLLHPEDRAQAIAARDRARASGTPLALQYRLSARDGRIVAIKELAVLVRDANGDPRFWQGVRFAGGGGQGAESSSAQIRSIAGWSPQRSGTIG